MSNRLAHVGHSTAERMGHWLRALSGNDRSRAWCVAKDISLKDAGESVPNSAGGWLVPEDFDSEILAVVEQYGAFRQGADVRTITRDAVTRPRRIGGITASWLAEGASIPESQATLDGLTLSLKKIATLMRCSSELFDDAASDLGRWFAFETGYAIAQAEDDCGFNGDGSSNYVGTIGLTARLTGTAGAVSCASAHDTFGEVDSADLGSLMAQVQASALPRAAWYCNPAFYAGVICRLSVSTGGLIATQQPDGSVSASYLGYPVRMSGSINGTAGDGKVLCYFGDLSKSTLLVQRHASTIIAMSRQRLMDTDQILLRGTVREAIAIHDTTPVAMLLGKT